MVDVLAFVARRCAGGGDSVGDYRPAVKHGERLDALITYLQARAPDIPSYRERWRTQQYLGSEPVEKANDLLIARRQNHHGMHWRPCDQ